MSEHWKAHISRRPLLGALAALAGAVVAGGAIYEGVHVWHGARRDLLASLGSREQVDLVGKAVLADMPEFRATNVKALRHAISSSSLEALSVADAMQGRIVEAQGWVLPETLARLCAVVAGHTAGGFSR
jgi:hypothetical protein